MHAAEWSATEGFCTDAFMSTFWASGNTSIQLHGLTISMDTVYVTSNILLSVDCKVLQLSAVVQMLSTAATC